MFVQDGPCEYAGERGVQMGYDNAKDLHLVIGLQAQPEQGLQVGNAGL